jgi:O-acetyl-ADP-ribose deacetylase (regulator of RNase III)
MNQAVNEQHFASGQHLQLIRGDITQERVDAIVNAANAYLQHGAGVAGAISLNGGPQIQEESEAWLKKNGPVTHENPAYTSGGRLPCRYVIHAVGPVWGDGQEDEKLELAISGTLKVGEELGVKSIAFPAISTGIFGFPKTRAARIFFKIIKGYINNYPESKLKIIKLVLFDEESVADFNKVFYDIFMTPRDVN